MSLKPTKLMISSVLSILLILSFFNISYAQDAEVETERMQMSANYLSYHRETEKYLLRENVRIEYKDYIITGDEAEVIEDETVYISGNVEVKQNSTHLTGSRLIFNYRTEEITIKDGFEATYYRETDQKEENPITITGQTLIIDEENDKITAHEDVYLTYKDLNIWADNLKYSIEEDILNLTDNVRFEDEDGFIKSHTLIYNLETEDFEASQDVIVDILI